MKLIDDLVAAGVSAELVGKVAALAKRASLCAAKVRTMTKEQEQLRERKARNAARTKKWRDRKRSGVSHGQNKQTARHGDVTVTAHTPPSPFPPITPLTPSTPALASRERGARTRAKPGRTEKQPELRLLRVFEPGEAVALPDDFAPNEAVIEAARASGLDRPQIERALQKFRADRQAKGVRRSDWQAAALKWLLDEAERLGAAPRREGDAVGRATAAAATPGLPPSLAECLRSRLGEDVFASWFASARLGETAGGVARIHVPTRFLQSWLNTHYTESVLACLRCEHPDIDRVEFLEDRVARRRAG